MPGDDRFELRVPGGTLVRWREAAGPRGLARLVIDAVEERLGVAEAGVTVHVPVPAATASLPVPVPKDEPAPIPDPAPKRKPNDWKQPVPAPRSERPHGIRCDCMICRG